MVARRRHSRGWIFASLIALPYFVTSLVVVLNSIGNATGVVWLPSFPSWYYAAVRVLYWPFTPYFALLSPLQADPAVSYTAYAVISRALFLIAPLVIWIIALTRGPRRPEGSKAARRRRTRGQSALLTFLALGFAAAIALYALIAPLRETINAGIVALDPRDIGRLRDYLRGLGAWAPAVSFLLMVVQSVAAPLPAFVITIANGLLFGAFWGTVLSWSSAMVGAALCFGIARALGRPTVERLAGSGPVAKADAFFDRYGSAAVLIARLVPVISFDVVSYAAGLTRIGLLPFLVATGLGQLPATIVYSILGENLTSGSRAALWAAGALLSLLVLGVTAKSQMDRRLDSGDPHPLSREIDKAHGFR
ncbi:MAG: TVP38/TMEM64 family protein [Chloroflexota bacterium]|nr:TVP38/TMEM64 family protein [Chloroflexota bacterium]